ncbi:MAG: DUF89 family protein [Actinobacteria bacterium]|nr:DUF89 family protein [Actinomycetota bacterium]
MKIYLECIPCHIRSAINSAMLLTDDVEKINRTIKEVLLKASEFMSYKNLFEIYYDIQTIVKKNIPDGDPYRQFKEEFNEICLSVSSELKKRIEDSGDWFDTALRICLAGNSIDVMQGKRMTRKSLLNAIDNAVLQPVDNAALNRLKSGIEKASNILFIGDNAGEIVFDRIFIEFLNQKFNKEGKITYVVRGGPTLNDSTIEDAEMVGMRKVAAVITTGADMPVAYFPKCSEQFISAYKNADLVISKGQGNLEALLEENKNIFFLLKIKCDVIAKFLGNKHSVEEIAIINRQG